MGQGSIKAAALCAALTLQAGCDTALSDNPVVAKLSTGMDMRVTPDADGTQVAALAQTPTQHDATLNAESVVLQNLLARRSVLPAGSAY
ncbi:MAG: hypothetical protein AAFO86_09875, partial [Pseudomonadota bacterium]